MARLLLEEKYISSTAIIRKDVSSKIRSAPPRSFVRKMRQLIITVGRVAKIISTRKVRTMFVGINFDDVKLERVRSNWNISSFPEIFTLFSPPIFLSLLLNHFIESGDIS